MYRLQSTPAVNYSEDHCQNWGLCAAFRKQEYKNTIKPPHIWKGFGPGAHMHGTDEVWYDDASQEAIENWPDRPSDPPRMLHLGAFGWVNTLHPSDDHNIYSLELRELLSWTYDMDNKAIGEIGSLVFIKQGITVVGSSSGQLANHYRDGTRAHMKAFRSRLLAYYRKYK
ncbi:uncharacterized protein LOC110941443 isoform X2 [Helianthus annuus]|uniref:uncharacterized protein LOC110941443 isoform X2 n=1 Tax=Helianthus annuus TaxID=4232 RepID=UPI0016532DB8|nr:uncharacterized protein LOC110941443 isoform X2 [Helianthus annuus]